MAEKKQKTMQEKMNTRRELMVLLASALYIAGGVFAVAHISAIGTYDVLRSDDYMDDPTIPYNERGNATYTFTDQWLKDTYYRQLWYIVPYLIAFGIGGVILLSPDAIITRKEIHQQFCKGTDEVKYCAECGLKLSELEKK